MKSNLSNEEQNVVKGLTFKAILESFEGIKFNIESENIFHNILLPKFLCRFNNREQIRMARIIE